MSTIYSYEINGLTVQTGDLLCTTDGDERTVAGRLWQAVGTLIPGPIDHVVLYIGPEGRCVEANAWGVVTFEVTGHHWDGPALQKHRAHLVDTLYGVAYPLRGRGLSAAAERNIRAGVRAYALEQVAAQKPYNVNFFNPTTDAAFYCSQLIYHAYHEHGLDLRQPNTSLASVPLLNRVVLPQELWDACEHERVPQAYIPDADT